MWRSLASNALSLLIVAVIAVGIVVAWAQARYQQPGPLTEAVCLSVPRGGTMEGVSEDLERLDAVANPVLFRMGSDYAGLDAELKAGNFLIEPGASMEQIVETITRGGASTCGSEIHLRIGVADAEIEVRELDPSDGAYVELAAFAPGDTPPDAYAAHAGDGFARYRVTLAEGVTSWQAADVLGRAPFLEGEIGEVPEEGTLAPGSYEVTAEADRAGVVERMQQEQQATLTAAWAGRARDLPLSSAGEALILASIIEKETGVAEERRRIAGVFTNRLEEGMRLQTDPTVIYGVTGGQAPLGRGLRASELRRATPYNTYVIDGLPPTPIANPGQAAIAAAVNPEENDFLFFVADGTGGHAFAETLVEHNANVRDWRRIEAERASQ